MNETNLLNELQSIYGKTCMICSNKDSNIFMHLVPLQLIRYARNLNKRKNRKHKRKLPEITNYQLNNLLPVCSHCQIKQNADIYKLANKHQLEIIDRKRQQYGYPELITAGNIRNLHKLLASQNKHNERKHDASQKIT